MAGITAAAVKSLRDKTGLPMMECKKALTETGGDEEAAIQALRERGEKLLGKRADRATDFGRIGVYADIESGVGAMVEFKCESASVQQLEEFIELTDDLAKVLATGSGAANGEELLAQASTIKDGQTLGTIKDEMFNRIREVFNIGRMVRVAGACGGYSHNSSTVAGVLLEVEGGNNEAAKDISMHVAAMNPSALVVEDLDADEVAKEKGILTEAARSEGKPEPIIEKMVEGRMRSYYAQTVLLEQPFVKDDKMTVRKHAEAHGMKVNKFHHWVLGDDQPAGEAAAE
ncbi:MAG: translation elongation factor Ts [Blastopirellula sp.]|nr:MAG: translation elongation factor Ts [Blastopirellula sp.]